MTDLDDLMARLEALDATDPASWKAKDIDDVIAYQRKARAQREAGVKPKRGKGLDDGTPKKKIDLVALGLIAKAEPFARRKL